PNKARGEYDKALALQARGVPTPRPLAWGVGGSALGPSASWLITETLTAAQSLLAFLEATLPALPPLRQARIRQRLAPVLGVFVAKMHAAGVVHHDLHPGNLMVSLDAEDEPRLWLIDLHSVSVGPPCSRRICRSNLVILNRYFILRASRTDRLRFWTAYRTMLRETAPEPDGQTVR